MRLLILASLLGLATAGPAIASELEDTAAALRAVSVAEQDDTVVPASLVPLEGRFKRLLRDEAIRALPDTDAGQVDLDALKPVLDALARRLAPADDSDEAYRSGPIYGSVLAVRAEHPGGRPDLLAIVTRVRVGCGEDASLALMARRGGRWVDVLDVDSGAIRKISDAYGLFQYSVAPAAADGSFLVAHAHVTPWCQSNWQGLRHALLRVPARGAARRLYGASESLFLGASDPVYEIHARAAGYSLRFTTEGAADDPATTRLCSQAFTVLGDGVRRGRPRFTSSP